MAPLPDGTRGEGDRLTEKLATQHGSATVAAMTTADILNLTVHTIGARLGGQLRLSCKAGVWRCNGVTGPTLAGTIVRALTNMLVAHHGLVLHNKSPGGSRC